MAATIACAGSHTGLVQPLSPKGETEFVVLAS